MEAEAAVADEADAAVEALEAAVAEAESDGGEDAARWRRIVRALTNGVRRDRDRDAQASQALRCAGASARSSSW